MQSALLIFSSQVQSELQWIAPIHILAGHTGHDVDILIQPGEHLVFRVPGLEAQQCAPQSRRSRVGGGAQLEQPALAGLQCKSRRTDAHLAAARQLCNKIYTLRRISLIEQSGLQTKSLPRQHAFRQASLEHQLEFQQAAQHQAYLRLAGQGIVAPAADPEANAVVAGQRIARNLQQKQTRDHGPRRKPELARRHNQLPARRQDRRLVQLELLPAAVENPEGERQDLAGSHRQQRGRDGAHLDLALLRRRRQTTQPQGQKQQYKTAATAAAGGQTPGKSCCDSESSIHRS